MVLNSTMLVSHAKKPKNDSANGIAAVYDGNDDSRFTALLLGNVPVFETPQRREPRTDNI
jgi:hypothetical protein